MASDERVPGRAAAWRAFLAMVGAGSLALIPLVAATKQAVSWATLGAWQLVGAYVAVLLIGSRTAHRSACALARGEGLLVGPLLGALTFAVAAASGCLVNVVVADVGEGESAWWDRGVVPLVTLLFIGLLPALLIGGVFTAVLLPWLPRRPPPPLRPPGA